MENSRTKKGNENVGQNAPLDSANATARGVGSSDSITGAATATARSFYDQAKETAGQAYGAVTEKAAGKLDEQRTTLSDGLTAVADSVRQVSSNLGSSQTESGLAEAAARYTDTAARKIEDAAGYFEKKDVRSMARDLESFARRNPALFVGAAFGIGLLLARFLKSTAPDEFSGSGGDYTSASFNDRTGFQPTPSQRGTESRAMPPQERSGLQSAQSQEGITRKSSTDPSDFSARPQ